MIKFFKYTILFFSITPFLMSLSIFAADFTVSVDITTVDGDNFCGGSACSSNDTIIIQGGPRGSLLFQDFDGRGSYIKIVNESRDPDGRVEIDGVLQFDNCKYVDLGGNNDPDLYYGIKVLNDAKPSSSANSVRVMGKSNHLKLGFIEVAFDGNDSTSGIGIFVQDGAESASWVWDNIEIHNNYIHGSRYAGMYIGQNKPLLNDDPYLANVSIHNNIIEDSGAYGITLKGISPFSNVCSIYNNTIRNTGIVTPKNDSFKYGISVGDFYGTTFAEIYNNTVENTKGAGIQARELGGNDGISPHQIYRNTLINCGTNNDEDFAHGIRLTEFTQDVTIYENTIIRPSCYAIYSSGSSGPGNVVIDNNTITDPGLGDFYSCNKGDLVFENDTTTNSKPSKVSNLRIISTTP